jgi:signal transduction histidine kinase
MSSAFCDVGTVAVLAQDDERVTPDRARAVYLQELHGALADERAARLTAERTVAAFKELLAEKTRACAEANAAIRMRDDLLAAVSHDLKNPLAAISLIGVRLQRAGGDARAARTAEMLLRAAHHMDDLIVNLQNLARMQTGEPVLALAPTALDEVLRQAVELLGPIAEQRGARLALELAHLPVVRCDATQVLRVLSNLIGNAIRFTPAGQAITVSVAAGDEQVTLTIADRGPGIPPDHLPHLFEPYWSGWPEHGTLGLGLAIARGIVQAHGGRIWAESEPGQGSTFSFTLPLPATASRVG